MKLWLIFLFQVNDTLDDIFNDSDEEEESQDIVNQVLDEIGIEISGKVWGNCFPLFFKSIKKAISLRL